MYVCNASTLGLINIFFSYRSRLAIAERVINAALNPAVKDGSGGKETRLVRFDKYIACSKVYSSIRIYDIKL